MSGDLIGDLSKSRLFDLVKHLVDGKKAGMIVIGGSEVRELYVEGGRIVHCRNGPLVGEDKGTWCGRNEPLGRLLFADLGEFSGQRQNLVLGRLLLV